MLYVSLVPSAILLIAAHVAARPDPRPVRWVGYGVMALVVTFAPSCLMMWFQVVFVLAVLLGVALVAWRRTRRRMRVFLPYSLTALLLAYGFAAWTAWERYERAVALRGPYPMESMAKRVPEPSRTEARPADDNGLPELDWEMNWGHHSPRARDMRWLHEWTTEAFVNSPGFGATRMRPTPTAESLKDRSNRPDPPPQPESAGPPWGLGEVQFVLPDHDRKAARDLHVGGLNDFANTDGWGYVRSRREVAGFLPHAFSRLPTGREWKVVRVELVGLLKHPEPVMYVTAHLPAMADLKDAPTRPPDAFETAGLAAIHKGDDGFAGRRGDEVRYVGAVRSATACVKCHGGERGDLLGAFSYRLRPAP